jgi:glycine oxidase
MTSRTADSVIIGDGVIGLSTAYELARAGLSCCVVGAHREGAASGAAAGLLAPSIGQLSGSVAAFFNASLDLYPQLVDALREFDPELRLLSGLIEVWTSESRESTLPSGATRLGPADLAALEPNVDATFGGVLHARDGAVDNVRLVATLRAAVRGEANVRNISSDPVTRIDVDVDRAAVTLQSGARLSAANLILAAGAWSQLIEGLPRALPISPLKGQMLAVEARALRHPVMGDDVYLVPRGGEISVGATVEDVGFDLSTTPEAIESLRRAAVRLVPSLGQASVSRRWAGLRPATPDRLPIIGPDPERRRLIYACGHAKNGILLAPATANAVAALVQGVAPAWELAPFSINRFLDADPQIS